VPFTSLGELDIQPCWGKTVLLSQTAMFQFSSSEFNLQSHIVSICRVALALQAKIKCNSLALPTIFFLKPIF